MESVAFFDYPGGLSDRVAYRAQQASLLHLSLLVHRRWGILRDAKPTDADEASLNAAWRRYSALLERDLLNVRERLYPRALLFELPMFGYARVLPALLENAPRVMMRRVARDFFDLPGEVDLSGYPEYYRQTFHWQTDGYLSRRSAALYDVAVELLFLGTADVMRRQVIPPVTRFLRSHPRNGHPLRLLDVGCGTGRTLAQLSHAHPALELNGVELSPFYADYARERLGRRVASLVAANAEELPFRDGSFDVVTSVFLFHELPRGARRRVFGELARVLRPGGLLVVEDSAQLREAKELELFMRSFAREFHEPFFEDYVSDDLEELCAGAGLELVLVESHFVSKVVAAKKAAPHGG